MEETQDMKLRRAKLPRPEQEALMYVDRGAALLGELANSGWEIGAATAPALLGVLMEALERADARAAATPA